MHRSKRQALAMFLLFVIAFLHLPTATVSLRTHLSNSLKLKCESLLYRTLYADDQCYFAILEEIDENKASKKCSSILTGAKAALGVSSSIFAEMRVDKSKFRQEDESGANFVMCAYETGYKCDSPAIMMNSGRCFVRAPKKMNFVDANKYCQERGMDIPAPANEVDNRIIRDVLVKDPVWLQKSIVRESKFKWSQITRYSKWSTCEGPSRNGSKLYAGSQNAQWSCNKDAASVIDQTGYWSNGGVQDPMNVVCTKPAVNDFTKAEISCNYHASVPESAEKLTALPVSPNGLMAVCPSTCYALTRTTTRYDFMGRATVETQRGCEVLCDAKHKCAGFSFKEAGSTSSCVLLTTTSSNAELCSTPTTILLKKTSGCAGRTNMTAEFGDDPCIDSFIPITQSVGKYTICPQDANYYIIRAIDANGRRITLDNDVNNWLEYSCGMWVYRCSWRGKHTITPIVAATCARAGDRCPCAPIKQQVDIWGHQKTYPMVPNIINPCQQSGWIIYDVVKIPGEADYKDFTLAQYQPATVNCKAGMWILFTGFNSWGSHAISCVKK